MWKWKHVTNIALASWKKFMVLMLLLVIYIAIVNQHLLVLCSLQITWHYHRHQLLETKFWFPAKTFLGLFSWPSEIIHLWWLEVPAHKSTGQFYCQICIRGCVCVSKHLTDLCSTEISWVTQTESWKRFLQLDQEQLPLDQFPHAPSNHAPTSPNTSSQNSSTVSETPL